MGGAYTKHYDAITADVKNKVKCLDDTLLWSDNIEQCFTQVSQYLDLCGRNGVILNPEKFTFAADEVEFAGFYVINTSNKPWYHATDFSGQSPNSQPPHL